MITLTIILAVVLVTFLAITSAIIVRKILIGLMVALFAYRAGEYAVKKVKHLHAKRNARKLTHQATPVSGYSPRPGTIYC